MHKRMDSRFRTLAKGVLVPLFILICWAATAVAGLYNAKQGTLRNGLQVIVIENPRAPLVAQIIVYRVGGADDPIGKSGVAHYLEHMMFRGPKNSSHVKIMSLVESFGGQINATTSNDVTTYYEVVPKEHIEKLVRLEADRMRSLTVVPEQAALELKVVLEEQLMRVENSPYGKFFQEVEAAFYRHHPYGRPLIGWLHELKALTASDVKEFHDTWYAPNNATLLFVGDITFENAMALAKKYYEPIPRRATPKRQRVQEPPHTAQTAVTFHSDKIDTPSLVLLYQTPVYDPKNPAAFIAMELLEVLLGGTSTSYLYRRLVEDKKVATTVSVEGAKVSLDPRAMYVMVSASSFTSLNEVQAVYETELASILKKGFTAEEVAKVKKRILVSLAYLRDSLLMNADGVADALSIGVPMEHLENFPQLLEQVTVDEVNKVFRNLFNQPYTIGYILPQGMQKDTKTEKKKAGTAPSLETIQKGIS